MYIMKKEFLGLMALMVSVLPMQELSAARVSMPGAACHAYNGSGANRLGAFNDTGIRAISSVRIVCPITQRDVPASFFINLYHPSNRSTRCYLNRADDTSGSRTFVSKLITGSGNRHGIINIPTRSGASSRDTFSVDCNLASGTVVRGFDWTE